VICVADSGSTKTEWVFIHDNGSMTKSSTIGLNPYIVESSVISDTLRLAVADVDSSDLKELHFYGAGCSTDAKVEKVFKALERELKNCQIHVHHDLLAAARALCQNEEGIVGILGTGSSSCHYDGERILKSMPPLGWIIGDEGAGSFIGKELIRARYYNEMADPLAKAFDAFLEIDLTEFLDKIYNQPLPNKFLASLTRFCSEHLEDDLIKSILQSSLAEFVDRILVKYDRPDLQIHFTGSIASVYNGTLKEILKEKGLLPGRILKSPMAGLLKYHGIHEV
jgi:N-acetylglucosamine kinase-like BadF-type ATPase